MTFQGDPYRTLGIPPRASLNEIRSAYRRLVKKYHPDTAGERALPRFLAIQAAYEQLVDGEGRLRASGAAGQPGKGPRAAGGGGPAASRDAWRARRAAGASGGGSRTPGGRAGPARATPGAGTGPGGTASGADGRSSARRPAGEEPRTRRGTRKATPGSTTYDEAAETPLDPAWDGSSWYGPTSGTYWTLNPREYADPRKHGPEYEARARRAARAEAEGASPAAATDVVPEPDPAGEAGPRGGP